MSSTDIEQMKTTLRALEQQLAGGADLPDEVVEMLRTVAGKAHDTQQRPKSGKNTISPISSGRESRDLEPEEEEEDEWVMKEYDPLAGGVGYPEQVVQDADLGLLEGTPPPAPGKLGPLRADDPGSIPGSIATPLRGVRNSSSDSVAELRDLGRAQLWAIDRSEVTLGKELSKTHKSTVYQAFWRGMRVVAKTVKEEDTPDLAIRKLLHEELRHEIRILSTLRHPNLVMFLGACLDANPMLFITEFMPGGDLESYYLARRKKAQAIWKPPTSQVLQWGACVARALCFMHSCTETVIHRDLKPMNILLTEDETVAKVVDFGISRMVKGGGRRNGGGGGGEKNSDGYAMTGGIGSLRYMAPEVQRYEQYSEKVDIYAFALVLWFMATGRQPFDVEFQDPERLLEAYGRGSEPQPKETAVTHPALRRLIVEAWHVDPQQRPTAFAMTERLEMMLARELSRIAAKPGCTVQ